MQLKIVTDYKYFCETVKRCNRWSLLLYKLAYKTDQSKYYSLSDFDYYLNKQKVNFLFLLTIVRKLTVGRFQSRSIEKKSIRATYFHLMSWCFFVKDKIWAHIDIKKDWNSEINHNSSRKFEAWFQTNCGVGFQVDVCWMGTPLQDDGQQSVISQQKTVKTHPKTCDAWNWLSGKFSLPEPISYPI